MGRGRCRSKARYTALMSAQAIPRRTASLIFTAGLFGTFALVTGLIGFRPRSHFNFVDSSRLIPGVWTNTIIWDQVAIGVGFLVLSTFLFFRTNRRLSR